MRLILAVLALLLAGNTIAISQVPETAPDDGDAPLPAGALARIGTTRLRHGGSIHQMVFSPDSRILASSGYDQVIRCWDLATGKQLWASAPNDDVAAITFSPDGAKLGWSDCLTHMRTWNVSTGQQDAIPVADAVEQRATYAITFGADGKRLTLFDEAYGIASYEFASRRFRQADIKGRKNQGGKWSALSPGAKYGAANGDLWRIDTGKMIGTVPAPVQIVAISPDGRHVASPGENQFDIWEAVNPRFRHAITVRGNTCLTFAPDGRTFATAGSAKSSGEKSEVCLFDLATGKERHRLRQDTTNAIVALAFSPDTRLLAMGTEGGLIRLLDVAMGKERLVLRHGLEAPLGLAWGTDRGTLVVQTAIGVHTYDTAKSTTAQAPWHAALKRFVRLNEVAALAPGGRLALAEGTDAAGHDAAFLWDVVRGVRLFRLSDTVHLHAVFAPNARTVAVSGTLDDAIWDVATGKRLWQLPKEPRGVAHAFSRDGKVLVTADVVNDAAAALRTNDRTLVSVNDTVPPQIRFWDVTTGKQIRHFAIPDDKEADGEVIPTRLFGPIGLAPSSRLLAVGSRSSVRVLDAVTGKVLVHLPKTWAMSAFSPDGRVLATGSWLDGEPVANGDAEYPIELWEVATGKRFAALRGHAGPTRALLFAADGRTLASSSADNTVLIWDVCPQRFGKSAAKLDADALARCWRDLAGADAVAASAALAKLAHDPAVAIGYARENLRPVPAIREARLRALIANLDSDDYDTRKRALADLAQIGAQASGALRNALKAPLPLEARRRIQRLLDRLHNGETNIPPGDFLRLVRVIRLLESIGSAEARELLQHLASGAAHAQETDAAQAALQRVKQ